MNENKAKNEQRAASNVAHGISAGTYLIHHIGIGNFREVGVVKHGTAPISDAGKKQREQSPGNIVAVGGEKVEEGSRGGAQVAEKLQKTLFVALGICDSTEQRTGQANNQKGKCKHIITDDRIGKSGA